MRSNLEKIYNKLIKTPHEFSCDQAMHILEQYYVDKKKFAEGYSSIEEPLKLSNYIKLSVPKNDCIKIEKKHNLFILNTSGLLGINGILPNIYTEKTYIATKNNQFAFIDFINIFQHRYLALRYKIEKNYEQTLKNKYNFDDTYIITGLNNLDLKNEFTPFLSLILNKNKTKNNLINLIQNILQLEVNIYEFQEKWYKIPQEHQLILNKEQLINKAIGYKSKNIQTAIKIELLFETFKQYTQYLENKTKETLLKKIIKYYLNNSISFTIKYKIKTFTTKTTKANYKNKLGITTWL